MAKRQSAYSRVLKEAQQQQSGETVKPLDSETEERFEKTTFYLTAEQVGKLDDLAHDHKNKQASA